MNPTLKNILAVILGFVAGSIVNMSIVAVGGYVVPLPDGFDNKTMEGLASTIHLLEPKHFLMTWLAHALGTLAGALIAALIAASHHKQIALAIGVFFLLAGIYMVTQLPAPMWFNAVDLIFAYIPMAYLGWRLVGRKKLN